MRINNKSSHFSRVKRTTCAQSHRETANKIPLTKFKTIKDHNASSRSPGKLINRTKMNFQVMHTMKSMSLGRRGKEASSPKMVSTDIKIYNQGYLLKSSNGKRKYWSKVYCILRGNSLLWTKSYEHKRVKGCIQFDLYRNLKITLKDSATFMFIFS
eukprot:TRINITY_DN2637_c0_g2_i8.p2 TRINITY_DN2637_c0_g2~~TRINITY_DN2637_c0_g2_i8.p2  ORF type:complete len:156 (-),score=15.85 TRINITY_DN2637_c0_g2_i8:816-1283(-)